MANNANNRINPGPGNQSSASRYSIRGAFNLTVNRDANTFKVLARINVFLNNVFVPNAPVSLEEGVFILSSGVTDASGQTLLEFEGTLTSEAQSRIFVVRTSLANLESAKTFEIPAKKEENSDNDPEKLILSRYHDGMGNFRVHIRVLKHMGAPMETPVNIWYRGSSYPVNTDQCGECVFDVPGILHPGDSFTLTATVPGIAEAAKVKINYPRLTQQFVRAFSPDWWIGTNNGRAFLFLMASTFLVFLSLLIGTGESPLFNDMTFRSEETGLSFQEELYNRVVEPVDKNLKIAPKEHEGVWKNYFMLCAFIFFLFSIVYAIFSTREEIAEAFRDVVEKIMDRPDAQSGDPLFERLVKWAGVYSVARSNKTKADPQLTDDHGQSNFLTMFKSDLLSEVIVKLVPAFFRKVF